MIEAGLERVRSKTMSMHNSQDVGETVALMFEELVKLEVKTNRCGILILSNSMTAEVWTAKSNPNGKASLIIGKLDLTMHPLLQGFYHAWENKESVFTYPMIGDDLISYYQAINNTKLYPTQFDLNALPSKEFHTDFYFAEGSIFSFTDEILTEEAIIIFKRFAGVFGQTYRRYLDLQKAEALAKESQIQLALERVRARTMAMQKSDELKETANLLFRQVQSLGISVWSCGFNIWQKDENNCTGWMSTNNELQPPFSFPLTENPTFKRFYESRKKKEDFYAEEVKGDALEAHYRYMISLPEFEKIMRQHIEKGFSLPHSQVNNVANFAHGNLIFITSTYVPEASDIFKRFAKVFEQTYTRFLDLQKAEAQAREAQIEASLERVRSKTMAMHNSQDVGETVVTLFDELVKLGLDELIRCGIGIMHEPYIMEAWTASKTNETKSELVIGRIDMNIHPLMQGCFDGWKYKKEVFQYILEGDDKINYYNIINVQPNYNARRDIATLSDLVVLTAFYFNEGCLYAFSVKELSSETAKIFIRFVTVFGQTYRRYLDLQKAEAQAREATIETALEKIRSRSLAMHHSEELKEVIAVMFEKMTDLNVLLGTIALQIFDEKTKSCDFWLGNDRQNPALVKLPFNEQIMKEDNYMQDCWEAKTNGVNIINKVDTLTEVNIYFDYVFAYNDETVIPQSVRDFIRQAKQHAYCLIIEKHSSLFVDSWNGQLFNEERIIVLKRVAKVFDQAYIRFLDIQNAEVQALEALKRASVDRVRAEIASMRTSNDLERITPIIWNELTTLGVPFIRCGVFIMDEENQQIQTMLSTAEGKAIASFQLPYENSEPLTELIPHWRKMEIYLETWDEKTFIESTKLLLQRGAISSPETYATEHPPTNLHLHFLPFLQGMLYVGNEAALNKDELHLVQNLADAFSIAYARYEDFNKLESAKEQIEKTLKDLKATQSLLIQSEKMASLGELTAGIAHEIQNPLNFVNNFSEVSTELVDEMNEEIQKGNLEDAQQIAADLKDNLSKINHHGKRAGDIVRGMLQHSRSSSGQKEPTDINALADEYLRLAYHGLRAKDKSFNATMNTDFDQSIGTIKIIPQDIGRVILNLITNAFYVVNEKAKSGIENYKPTVSVSTKKIGDKILISVKDNGNGIPQKILDKIFQPFFTTKPTGQGTGLGLSLSYDIIKAHGGDVKVVSQLNIGADFIITLPI
jgi:signal transduction histidine kinase